MRLRPFIPDRDFDAIRNWISDERTHAMWCAGLIGYPLEKGNFLQVMDNIGIRFGDAPFVMITGEGKAAGFFCFSVDPATNEGKLKFVIVDPALRGTGMGKTMLKLALEYAFSAAKADAVQLSVFQENTAALKCYESVGFAVRRTDAGAFRFQQEAWSRCNMVIRKNNRPPREYGGWTVQYNQLNAEQFIELWESVWGAGPSPEQAALGLEHSLFRVSVFDGERIVAMARMIGDMGLCCYIKDVVVRPEYQRQGVGRLLIQELLSFIRQNGIAGTDVSVELCAMPDKIPFYERFGFSANEAQRLRKMYRVESAESRGGKLLQIY